MTGIFRRLRQRREQEPGVARALARRPEPQWRVLESVPSPALGSLYVQVLQRADIPVMTRQWGAGAGALGGALTGVTILVPADHFDDARAALDVGMAGSEVHHE